MRLIKCPACFQQVFDQAISCPHCGHSLKSDNKAFIGKMAFGTMAMFAVIAVVLFGGFFYLMAKLAG